MEKKEKEGELALEGKGSDQLKEELSCAICLEIFFEPSTTTCGHSFCKKCLDFAADNCGNKCPKCRQPISDDRLCTVSTVLWNIIQLLFPQEVEARKAAGVLNNHEIARQSPTGGSNEYIQDSSRSVSRHRDVTTRRREVPSQVEDAGLGSSLQRDINVTARRNLNVTARRNFVPSVVEDLGAQMDLHGVAMSASINSLALAVADFRAQMNLHRAAILASLNSSVSELLDHFRAEMDQLNSMANRIPQPYRLVAQSFYFVNLWIAQFLCLVYLWVLDLLGR